MLSHLQNLLFRSDADLWPTLAAWQFSEAATAAASAVVAQKQQQVTELYNTLKQNRDKLPEPDRLILDDYEAKVRAINRVTGNELVQLHSTLDEIAKTAKVEVKSAPRPVTPEATTKLIDTLAGLTNEEKAKLTPEDGKQIAAVQAAFAAWEGRGDNADQSGLAAIHQQAQQLQARLWKTLGKQEAVTRPAAKTAQGAVEGSKASTPEVLKKYLEDADAFLSRLENEDPNGPAAALRAEGRVLAQKSDLTDGEVQAWKKKVDVLDAQGDTPPSLEGGATGDARPESGPEQPPKAGDTRYANVYTSLNVRDGSGNVVGKLRPGQAVTIDSQGGISRRPQTIGGREYNFVMIKRPAEGVTGGDGGTLWVAERYLTDDKEKVGKRSAGGKRGVGEGDGSGVKSPIDIQKEAKEKLDTDRQSKLLETIEADATKVLLGENKDKAGTYYVATKDTATGKITDIEKYAFEAGKAEVPAAKKLDGDKDEHLPAIQSITGRYEVDDDADRAWKWVNVLGKDNTGKSVVIYYHAKKDGSAVEAMYVRDVNKGDMEKEAGKGFGNQVEATRRGNFLETLKTAENQVTSIGGEYGGEGATTLYAIVEDEDGTRSFKSATFDKANTPQDTIKTKVEAADVQSAPGLGYEKLKTLLAQGKSGTITAPGKDGKVTLTIGKKRFTGAVDAGGNLTLDAGKPAPEKKPAATKVETAPDLTDADRKTDGYQFLKYAADNLLTGLATTATISKGKAKPNEEMQMLATVGTKTVRVTVNRAATDFIDIRESNPDGTNLNPEPAKYAFFPVTAKDHGYLIPTVLGHYKNPRSDFFEDIDKLGNNTRLVLLTQWGLGQRLGTGMDQALIGGDATTQILEVNYKGSFYKTYINNGQITDLLWGNKPAGEEGKAYPLTPAGFDEAAEAIRQAAGVNAPQAPQDKPAAKAWPKGAATLNREKFTEPDKQSAGYKALFDLVSASTFIPGKGAILATEGDWISYGFEYKGHAYKLVTKKAEGQVRVARLKGDRAKGDFSDFGDWKDEFKVVADQTALEAELKRLDALWPLTIEKEIADAIRAAAKANFSGALSYTEVVEVSHDTSVNSTDIGVKYKDANNVERSGAINLLGTNAFNLSRGTFGSAALKAGILEVLNKK